MQDKFKGFFPNKAKKRWYYIFLILPILAFLIDYYGGIVLENYESYTYNMNFSTFLVIIFSITTLLLFLPDSFGSSEREVDEENSAYLKTGYEEYLSSLLQSSELNSIFINGPFGCGKTTMLEYVLKSMDEKNDYIKIDLYGANIENNLDFIYSQFKNQESKVTQILKNTITHTITSFLALVAVIIGAMYSKSTEISIFITIAILYTIVSAYIQYTKTTSYKENYIQKKINSLDYIIVDDLDRAYIDKTSIVSLIHIISNYINTSTETTLILVGNRYTFFEKNNLIPTEQTHLLEKYYDFDFEFPIDIVRDQYINILKKSIPIVKYNVEQLSEMEPLIKNCSTRNIMKTNRYINFNLKFDPMVVTKLYISDYLFIAILYSKNIINVDEFLTDLENQIWSFHWTKDFETVKKKFANIINEYKFSENERTYLENALEYSYENIGNSFRQLGYYKYNNRLLNQPKYYKRNTYINKEKSPEERINEMSTKIIKAPETISPVDVYYFNTSSVDEVEKDKIISQIIKMAEDESSYESNLSRSIEYIVLEEDERVGLNLKYNWASKNRLDDSSVYQKLVKLITIENFYELSSVNRVNLLERAFYNEDNRYLNIIPKSEFTRYLEIFVDLKRPYNIYEIFGNNIKGVNVKLIKTLLHQYRELLENKKEHYNYYADNPERGIRTDKGDKDLEKYNCFKTNACGIFEIEEEEFYFSFND